MQLALLMTMLAVNGLFAVEVDVIFEGTLTCNNTNKEPAGVLVMVDEVDGWYTKNDQVGQQEFSLQPGLTSVKYKISGKAIDWWQDEVEPRLQIFHTCGRAPYDSLPAGSSRIITEKLFKFLNNLLPITLCKEYKGISKNLHEVINVDLNKPNIPPSTMKGIVLVSMIIACCLGRVEVEIRVKGTLTCPTPFYYKVTIIDEDSPWPDEIVGTEQGFSFNHTASFRIKGVAKEKAFFDNEVEPIMVLEHNCGNKTITECVCHYFDDTSKDFTATVNVDLAKPALKKCSLCLS